MMSSTLPQSHQHQHQHQPLSVQVPVQVQAHCSYVPPPVAPRLNPRGSVYDWTNAAVLCMQRGYVREAMDYFQDFIIPRLEPGGRPDYGGGRSMLDAYYGHAHEMDLERLPISSRTRSQQSPVPIDHENNAVLQPNDIVSSPEDREETMHLIAVPAAPSEHLAQTMSSSTTTTGSSISNDEPFVLFHRAFAPLCFDEDPTRGRKLGLAFCCYNLALCVHAELYRAEKLGLRSRLLLTDSSWQHKRAKLLNLIQANYHRVFQILFFQQQERNRPDGPILVLLATMNNLAHFYQTFFRHQQQNHQLQHQHQPSSYSHRMQQCASWMQRLINIKMEEQAQAQQQQQQHRRQSNPITRMIPPPPSRREYHFFIQAVQRYNAYVQHERWLDRVQLQFGKIQPAPAA